MARDSETLGPPDETLEPRGRKALARTSAVKWTVEWSRGAQKDLRRLDASTAQRVIHAVNRLAEMGEGDVKKLKDMGGLMRLRVGDWRVFFRFNAETETILVLEVAHRGDAYS